MRKDVKLGFAIGGVLLAVLIVYVLVVPGGGDKRLTSATGEGGAAQTGGSGGAGVSLEPVTPPAPVTPTNGNGAAAQAPPAAPPSTFTPSADRTDPFEQPEAVASSGSKSNLDWNKLLNDSQQVKLVTPEKPAVASAAARTGGASSSSPDITKPGPTPITPPPAYASQTARTTQAPPPVEPAPAQTITEPAPALPPSPPSAMATEIAGPPTAEQALSHGAPRTPIDASGQKIHIVAAGDTYSTISMSEYGNANLYAAIMRANPGIDPLKLRPGMKIVIPPLSDLKPAAAAAAPAAAVHADRATVSSTKVEAPIDPATQYRVMPGDSLYSIAK
ncbi:MAG: LysM domain, partial [Humisphaera sp.]|nr:LysM domain [Humisphaera sp.]